MKKFHKKITLGLIFFLVFIFINLIFVSQTVYGAPRIIEFKPQIPIPGGIEGQTAISPVINDGVLQSNLLSRYIKSLYDYGIAVAGILAAIVMMGGGVLWLTSGGSENRISQAKDLIFGSVIGLGLVFSSWIILNTVNPDLLNFNTIGLTTIRANFNNFKFCDETLGERILDGPQANLIEQNNEVFDISQNLKIGEVCQGVTRCGKPPQENKYDCYYIACCQAGVGRDEERLSWAIIVYGDSPDKLTQQCPQGEKLSRNFNWVTGFSGSVTISYHPNIYRLTDITAIQGHDNTGCVNR